MKPQTDRQREAQIAKARAEAIARRRRPRVFEETSIGVLLVMPTAEPRRRRP